MSQTFDTDRCPPQSMPPCRRHPPPRPPPQPPHHLDFTHHNNTSLSADDILAIVNSTPLPHLMSAAAHLRDQSTLTPPTSSPSAPKSFFLSPDYVAILASTAHLHNPQDPDVVYT